MIFFLTLPVYLRFVFFNREVIDVNQDTLGKMGHRVSQVRNLHKQIDFRYLYPPNCSRRGGLVVSALDSGSSGPGSSAGLGYCVVFLGKTLYSHSDSLYPGVYGYQQIVMVKVT